MSLDQALTTESRYCSSLTFKLRFFFNVVNLVWGNIKVITKCIDVQYLSWSYVLQENTASHNYGCIVLFRNFFKAYSCISKGFMESYTIITYFKYIVFDSIVTGVSVHSPIQRDSMCIQTVIQFIYETR